MVTTDPAAIAAWGDIPVDDVGYLSSTELLAMPDVELRRLVDLAIHNRYTGWRNHQDLWRTTLGLDRTTGKHVLDYGCGIGIEALQYAQTGNRVWLADIVEDNIRVATRVLRLYGGYRPLGRTLVGRDPWPMGIHVIHCAGVLHHIRDPLPTMRHFAEILRSNRRGGELRLMLYSDVGWQIATHSWPPPAGDTDDGPRRQFIEFFDNLGPWSDWYNEARLAERFGDLFEIARCDYITPDLRYLTATLLPLRPS